MSAGLVSAGASLLAWQATVFSLRPHTAFPLCVSVPGCPLRVTSHSGLGLTLMNLFLLHYFFKDSISKCSHILGHWG